MIAFIFALFISQTSSIDVTVMSFNIRYDNPDDGENAWTHRATWVANEMSNADIIGVQEGLSHQVEQLATKLIDYNWTGVGRDDGKRGGEFTPIFFKAAIFELLSSNTFWLSETPNQSGSKGWDAALPRIATTAHLKDKRTGIEFLIINTHFDHRGRVARLQSAQLLADYVRDVEMPALLMGDFNMTPQSDAYEALLEDEILRDSRTEVRTPPSGPVGTFSGFIKQENLNEAPRIDYIFTTHDFIIRQYESVISVKNDQYVSDHLPIKVDLQIIK